MKALRHLRRRFRRERGQTLILGVMAMVIILVGILVLFDVQRVIRGKVKVMSAIDSAALTGARWQQNTFCGIWVKVSVRPPFWMVTVP